MKVLQNPEGHHKSRKRFELIIILNVLLIAVILTASAMIYQRILSLEMDNCWNSLEDSAASIVDQIDTRLEDNINVLKLAANSMVTENRTGATGENLQIINSHLNDFHAMTIFSRIDLLLPNDQILIQNGGVQDCEWDFAELSGRGDHVTERQTDALTGKESVYCIVPVMKDGTAIAVLLGMLDCETLPAIFNTSMYDGQTYACLVDRSSGDFVMDPWHDTLGNVYEQSSRKTLKGYEHIDVREEVSQGNTGVVAYESMVNGVNSYMYFTPVDSVDWELIVVVQENAAFHSLAIIRKMLTYLGLVEGIMLLAYLIWTVWTLHNANKSRDEFEKLSYTDAGTGANNRQSLYHQYDKLPGQKAVGVIFCDITGLKEVNDTRGHSAGDELIRNTYECMKAGFEPFEIFRMGGDEFVVLSIGRSEEKLEKAMQKVRASMQERGVVAAMGMEWTAYMDLHIEQMISSAERKMYVEKSAWYRSSGKDRRKS